MLDKINEFGKNNRTFLIVAWAILTLSAAMAYFEGLSTLGAIVFFLAGIAAGFERMADRGLTVGLGTFLMYSTPVVGLISGNIGYMAIIGGLGAMMAFGILVGGKHE